MPYLHAHLYKHVQGKTAPSDKRHGEYNIQEQVFASRAYSYLDALNLRT